MATYYPTIGLEIHAELNTASKMFCGCKNDAHETVPNTNVCPVCLAHPGTLPVPNKEAIKKVIQVGLAVDGEIADFTEFDRKNYFYPDIPKGYQISQYKYPLVQHGSLLGFDITRIHLEEDTGTSIHQEGKSLVDYNRAGVPLMELVTEPVLHSADDAMRFAKELRLLLRELDVSNADMELGNMRVEVNISISPDKDKLGTKVEIKNLNSFSVVGKAIDYEIARMTKLHDEGRANEIVQETRGWSDENQNTFSQRTKENSDDYRYFPDPDIPKFYISELFNLDEIKAGLPELPWKLRARYEVDLKLNPEIGEFFLAEPVLRKYFEAGAELEPDLEMIKLMANYIKSDFVGLSLSQSMTHEDIIKQLPVVRFLNLLKLYRAGSLSSRGVKDLLVVMMNDDREPDVLAKELGYIQVQDESALNAIIDTVIAENVAQWEDYKNGKDALLQFMIGMAMKASKGSGNPAKFKELFEAKK
ncbi:MAG TPA: Asp-tRNA(Asn)/Glu-tRNA(Gln) amidotransferase subunit GatB [Candidatus Paceibacterota bacterium]